MRGAFKDLIEYLQQNIESFYYQGDFDMENLELEIKQFAAAFERQVQ